MMRHQRELESFYVLQQMRMVIAEKRRNRRKGHEGWKPYSFSNKIHSSLYWMIRHQANFQDFWNDFLATVIDDMGKYQFNLAPSVNGLSREDMGIPRGKSENTDIGLENNELLKSISLEEHTHNVVSAAESFYRSGKFAELTKEERFVLFLACLLHDFGKSMQLAIDYKMIDEADPKTSLNRVGHASCSSRYIMDRFEKSFNADGKMEYFRKDVERIALICAEHHNIHYQDRLSHYLNECDRIARGYEIAKIKATRNTHETE